jgi:two-component system chemotaxis response regulator CheB
MARKDIVVLGASAGGMDALQRIVAALPADLPASLFVVWHMGPGVRSVLPEVLTRGGPLSASHPQDGDAIVPGRIYVAPSDHHLLLEQGFVRVKRGPKENRFRPAVDPLFRSAAYVYGPRVIGVVLSGALDDGTSGLWTIKLRGGTTIVQDPEDAQHRSMPLHALQHVAVDHKLPAERIGKLLGGLVRERAGAPPHVGREEDAKTAHEVRIAEEAEALEQDTLGFGRLSPFTCPECHGALTMLKEGRIARFRCHTGHAFSANTLLISLSEQVEARLWDSVRAMDEGILLLNRLGREYADSGDTPAAERCFDRAREIHERSRGVREAALGGGGLEPAVAERADRPKVSPADRIR